MNPSEILAVLADEMATEAIAEPDNYIGTMVAETLLRIAERLRERAMILANQESQAHIELCKTQMRARHAIGR